DFPGDIRAVLADASGCYATDTNPKRQRGPSAQIKTPLISEGTAAVVLKRLEDAQRDGDRIYAVIKGIGTVSGDILRPAGNVDALQLGLNQVLAEAGSDSREVELVTNEVSDDIGHCGAALGLASLVKASLGLFHQSISDEKSELSTQHSVLTSESFDGNC